MRVPFYDIKAQYDELQSEMDRVLHEVIAGGGYVMGPHHKAFENECAELHGVKHAIAVNSGTDALRIVLDALGIDPVPEWWSQPPLPPMGPRGAAYYREHVGPWVRRRLTGTSSGDGREPKFGQWTEIAPTAR